MKRKGIIFGLLVLFLIVFFLLGPRPPEPKYSFEEVSLPRDVAFLEGYIRATDVKEGKTRPGNGSKIHWAKAKNQKTNYSIVYLHGFAASHAEGSPLHTSIADSLGANLFLPRLHAHGLEVSEPMATFDPEKYVQSAYEAVKIAEMLGDTVIVMACSTGATASLILAEKCPEVFAYLFYSPNIKIFDPRSKLLTKPWGLALAKKMLGSHHEWIAPPDADNYWYVRYEAEAIAKLQSMLEADMTKEKFKSFDKPLFMAYYYKNEILQDSVVSVPALLEMYDQIATDDAYKRKVAFPEGSHHVLTSSYFNPNMSPVIDSTLSYLQNVLQLKFPFDTFQN